MFWMVGKRAMSCLIWHLKILETFAFQAKPNSIDKRNRNKKLNVIKNAKKKQFSCPQETNLVI